jgi:hypothetical protein
MSREHIQVRGYGKVHIDIILVGAKVNGGDFDYALKVSSEQRLRRIIGDLEKTPDGQLTRISKLRTRLANLERMNAQLAAAAIAYKLAQPSDLRQYASDGDRGSVDLGGTEL